MTRLIPAFSLVFALISQAFPAQDSAKVKWRTDLQQEIFHNEMFNFEPRPNARADIFIDSAKLPARWDRIFREASRGVRQDRRPRIHLAEGAANPLEECRRGEISEPACLAALSLVAGTMEITLIVRDFRRDTTKSMRGPIAMGSGSGGAPNTPGMTVSGLGGIGSGSVRVTLYHHAAEVILVEPQSREIYFQALLVGSGPTPIHADDKLGRAIVKHMEKVFRPGVGSDYPRNVLAVNPLGLAAVTGVVQLYQVTYERMLGDGKWSCAWDPAYFSVFDDPRGIDYLFLPALGFRRYFRTEGRGIWLGAKAGYLYQKDLGETSAIPLNDGADPAKNHFLVLAAGPGITIPIGPVRLQGGLSIGMGMGRIQTWTTDWWGRVQTRSEYGFGVQPIVNAGLGVGWAY